MLRFSGKQNERIDGIYQKLYRDFTNRFWADEEKPVNPLSITYPEDRKKNHGETDNQSD